MEVDVIRRVASLVSGEALLRALFEDAAVGVAVIDADGGALAVDATFAEVLGVDADALMGEPVLKMLSLEDGRRLSVSQMLAPTGTGWSGEAVVLRSGESSRRVRVSLSCVGGTDDAPVCLLTAIDVTPAPIDGPSGESAFVDELTGLYNRRGFLALARRHLEIARRLGAGSAVLFMDLDGLKNVNDQLGHAEGDRMIKATADIIRTTMRESDVIGRIGGDEFVACVVETSAGGIDGIVRRLREALEASAMEPRPYHLRMSCGIAVADHEIGESIETLLEKADARMYAAKRAHGKARQDVLNVESGG